MKKYLFFIALIFIYNCTEHKSSSSSRYQDTEYEESEDYDEDEDMIRYEEDEVFPDDLYFSFYYYSLQVLLLCKPLLDKTKEREAVLLELLTAVDC